MPSGLMTVAFAVGIAYEHRAGAWAASSKFSDTLDESLESLLPETPKEVRKQQHPLLNRVKERFQSIMHVVAPPQRATMAYIL